MNCFSQVHDIGLCGIGTLIKARVRHERVLWDSWRPVAIATPWKRGPAWRAVAEMSVLAPRELAVQLDLERLVCSVGLAPPA